MTMKRVLPRIFLVVWVSVWALFLVRPYFKHDLLKTYRELLPLSLEDKHAYVTGQEFYDFLKLCKKSMNDHSTYSLVGFQEDAIESRRAVYYMYPCIPDRDPEYLLVYMAKPPADGYRVLSEFGPDKYLLRKVS